MSRRDTWIVAVLIVCAAALGVVSALLFVPEQTITKIKERTIVCLVNNEQAIASCRRVGTADHKKGG